MRIQFFEQPIGRRRKERRVVSPVFDCVGYSLDVAHRLVEGIVCGDIFCEDAGGQKFPVLGVKGDAVTSDSVLDGDVVQRDDRGHDGELRSEVAVIAMRSMLTSDWKNENEMI